MKKAFFLLVLIHGLSVSAFADELISVDKALGKIFRKATSFEAQIVSLSEEQAKEIEEKADITINGMHTSQLIMHTAKENGNVIGVGFEDTVFGKWGPIHYLAGIDPKGKVSKIIVLDYQEIRGKPVARNRFLRQYKGKSIKNPVRLRRDINGVTGATISSRSLTDGVRKILYIYDLLKDNR